MMTLDQGGRARGSVRLLQPHGSLQPAMEVGWILKGGGGGAGGWRVIPDAHPHLVVSRYPSGRLRARVVGPRSTWVDVDQGARTFTVGIRLRPGALPTLLGVPAHELRDGGISLEEGFGVEGRRLEERLEEAEEADGAARVLLEFLRRRTDEARDDRLAAALLANRDGRTSTVAAVLGISTRRLRDRTRDAVGLSPKEALRIHRFQRALTLLLDRPTDSGSRVAHAAGYADQPHMVHDFRRLVGETPEAFRARGSDSYKAEGTRGS